MGIKDIDLDKLKRLTSAKLQRLFSKEEILCDGIIYRSVNNGDDGIYLVGEDSILAIQILIIPNK